MADTIDPNISLDGTTFVNVGKDEQLYPITEFTVGGYVNTEDWNTAVSNQLFGNYYNQGFGLFYNSGIETDAISLVEKNNGILLNINDDGRAFFQRELPITGSNITSYTIDRRGVRSLIDNQNKKVYVFDSDSVDLHTIDLPSDANIIQSDVDAENGLWLMNEADCHVYWYDSNGTFINKTPYPSTHNNFVMKSNRTFASTRTNENTRMVLDCDENYFYILGQNLYKNGSIFYHVSPTASTFNIDASGNIWVTYNGDRMLKLTPTGERIFDRQYHSIVVCSRELDPCKPQSLQYFRDKSSITFTRENQPDGTFKNFTWVLLKEYDYLLKLNETGRLVKCAFLPDLFDLTKFPDLDVRDLDFSASAEFSDYGVNKRFSSLCDQDGDPFIQGKIVTETVCGRTRFIELQYDASLLISGEHHFAMTFDGKTGTAKLFVDGAKVDEVVDEPAKVFYNYKPPFLIGAKSGKFTAVQKERGLLQPVFFIGDFDDIRLYRKEFTEEDVNTLTKTKFTPRALEWNMELVNSASYLEQLERIFLHRSPGHKSNFFNIVINSLGITDTDARAVIEAKILQRLNGVKPAHTHLNKIIWSDTPSPIEPCPDGIKWEDIFQVTWEDGSCMLWG